MPRMKKTTKRSREESSVKPPPWNHPLARYFASNKDLVYYEMRLAGRKEIPPRLKKKETGGGLGFLCLWTRIFNRVGIDLTNEKSVRRISSARVCKRFVKHLLKLGG
ncbi:hypothetical protein PIB30_091050 [Stylosanthes scabra]|uniref:Uncharacterized protein n=1 Tax=Stylosanthes scabra TaxID=79078 RepID=A0ABU6WUE1_9FABA|nr:hypothetical protein [Stylosanthes scabra]